MSIDHLVYYTFRSFEMLFLFHEWLGTPSLLFILGYLAYTQPQWHKRFLDESFIGSPVFELTNSSSPMRTSWLDMSLKSFFTFTFIEFICLSTIYNYCSSFWLTCFLLGFFLAPIIDYGIYHWHAHSFSSLQLSFYHYIDTGILRIISLISSTTLSIDTVTLSSIWNLVRLYGSHLYSISYISIRLWIIFVLHTFGDHILGIIALTLWYESAPSFYLSLLTGLHTYSWVIALFTYGYFLLQLYVGLFLVNFFTLATRKSFFITPHIPVLRPSRSRYSTSYSLLLHKCAIPYLPSSSPLYEWYYNITPSAFILVSDALVPSHTHSLSQEPTSILRILVSFTL